jgi:hypothetical protein
VATVSTTDQTAGLASGPPGWKGWVRNTLLLQPSAKSPVGFRAFVIVTMGLGAAAIVATGAIHIHLWDIGYKNIASIGNLFLAQAIGGFVLGPVILLFRRMFLVLAGAAYMAASIGGLVLSATVGFLGLHDALSVPWATPSLIVESIGFALFVASGLALVARR